ncbi:MAG TPA: PhzF family phenazine biosynthesis protein [Opitutus sp.]|nr:PhzF family phenazine biosynthesis protein [Opitutus sp.]
MRLPLFWVDAFTDRVFSGNPAGVVPLDAWPADSSLLQRIAFENGLAETTFYVRTGAARFALRWFTPAVEVDLCGHATLAAGHVLFHELEQSGDAITFDSRSGPLVVTRLADEKLELDFPATPPAARQDAAAMRAVSDAIGLAPAWLGESKFDLFAVLPDTAAVARLRPDFARVAAAGARGLIVTAPGDSGCDFVSRFFAPQSGVPEDPVTGSAHSALAPYWAARLGKTKLHARQLSARGGELWCEVAGDRVKIAGRAALYLRGEISL